MSQIPHHMLWDRQDGLMNGTILHIISTHHTLWARHIHKRRARLQPPKGTQFNRLSIHDLVPLPCFLSVDDCRTWATKLFAFDACLLCSVLFSYILCLLLCVLLCLFLCVCCVGICCAGLGWVGLDSVVSCCVVLCLFVCLFVCLPVCRFCLFVCLFGCVSLFWIVFVLLMVNLFNHAEPVNPNPVYQTST